MLAYLPRRGAAWILAAAVLFGGPAPARPDGPDETADLNDLALEVNALQGLRGLKLTDAQLKQWAVWAKETAPKPTRREPAKASKEYRAKLLALREALVEATDDDAIDQLNDELDELRDSEKPRIDDGVEVAGAARKRAPQALRLLKLQQVRAYLDVLGDELGDPLDRLLAAFDGTRGLKGNEWKQRREEVVDDLVRLAAGIDATKADRLTDRLTALLSRAHGLSDADYKAERAGLHEEARKLVGDLGPLEVARNAVEHALAELLSNPRLPAALEACLKEAK